MVIFSKLSRNFLLILAFYLLARILLINLNYTEWGDTFRMVRGSEFLANFDWPWDEKRWPFYSVVLIPGILFGQPILFGRVIGILISLLTLIYIYFFYKKLVTDIDGSEPDDTHAVFSTLLVASSSVFAYWSFRVMADPLFTLMIVVFAYHFLQEFQRYIPRFTVNKGLLSLVLLIITMTRLEGLFMLSGVLLFLFVTKRLRDLILFIVPQLLVYVPWTFYAKFLYPGQVENDYFKEAEGFVFNLERFTYFSTYTIYLLVIPVFVFFIFWGARQIYLNANVRNNLGKYLPYLPLSLFILQELLIGFIWTPSLPRIYMPIIPFIVMIGTYGMFKFFAEDFSSKARMKYCFVTILLTAIFAGLQGSQKLYFLGASKPMFFIIIGVSVLISILMLIKNRWSIRLIMISLLTLNILVSSVVIYNQKDVYKSVKQGLEYLAKTEGVVAYADETGNSSWYLRNRSYYLPPDTVMSNFDEQYDILKQNNVKYVLLTDEFNRGSNFIDPRSDQRYMLLAVYSVPIDDFLEMALSKYIPAIDPGYFTFRTKIYEVL